MSESSGPTLQRPLRTLPKCGANYWKYGSQKMPSTRFPPNTDERGRPLPKYVVSHRVTPSYVSSRLVTSCRATPRRPRQSHLMLGEPHALYAATIPAAFVANGDTSNANDSINTEVLEPTAGDGPDG